MSEEKIFANGFSFKRNDKAPDFVIGRLSIKVGDAVEFLGMHERDGWVGLDIKMSKKGTYYVELDQFIPGNPNPQEQNRHSQNTGGDGANSPSEESQPIEDEGDGLPF